MTINLDRTKAILAESEALVRALHGQDLNERSATTQGGGAQRAERAKKSQDLLLLAERLELAAAMVRIEYWHARGHGDPIQPNRRN
jgi:hypothetical protein